MIIAYDLRYAVDHFPGVGTHAWHLLVSLLDLDGPERYSVIWNPRLANRRFPIESLRSHPRVEWNELEASPLGLGGVARVGAWLRARRPALYFSPFYVQPWNSRTRTVLTLHDVMPLTNPRLFGLAQRALFLASMARAREAWAVVTSSEFARREILEKAGLDAARVHLIRPGTPLPPVVTPEWPRLWTGGPYALVVGINKPHKNLDVLAKAWASKGAAPPLALLAAGPVDSRYPDLEELGRRHGARDLHALGPVDTAELDALYAHATAVLFPSRHEGFGFPLVEALARGVPVVVADIPPLREIGEGVAHMIAPDDAAGWTRAVQAIASDPDARARHATAAKARARELGYPRCAADMLTLFRGLTSP